MAYTQEQLTALLQERAEEGLYLEFKRGAALSREDRDRTELVKDCTGFANADGGTILYGIAEQELGGVTVAAGINPVVDARVDKNWISDILHSSTSPPLSRFEISELPQPDGGRVIAIQIEASSTAHQSLRDHKYYQRTGPTTRPMIDFQIRDVMARRTKPSVDVAIRMHALQQAAALHRYELRIGLTNTGSVSLEKWSLEVDVPRRVLRDTENGILDRMRNHPRFAQMVNERDFGTHTRVRISDPGANNARLILHPGQSILFDGLHQNFLLLIVEVDDRTFHALDGSPLGEIRWQMFFMNSNPLSGVVPFDQWSRF